MKHLFARTIVGAICCMLAHSVALASPRDGHFQGRCDAAYGSSHAAGKCENVVVRYTAINNRQQLVCSVDARACKDRNRWRYYMNWEGEEHDLKKLNACLPDYWANAPNFVVGDCSYGR